MIAVDETSRIYEFDTGDRYLIGMAISEAQRVRVAVKLKSDVGDYVWDPDEVRKIELACLESWLAKLERNFAYHVRCPYLWAHRD